MTAASGEIATEENVNLAAATPAKPVATAAIAASVEIGSGTTAPGNTATAAPNAQNDPAASAVENAPHAAAIAAIAAATVSVNPATQET